MCKHRIWNISADSHNRYYAEISGGALHLYNGYNCSEISALSPDLYNLSVTTYSYVVEADIKASPYMNSAGGSVCVILSDRSNGKLNLCYQEGKFHSFNGVSVPLPTQWTHVKAVVNGNQVTYYWGSSIVVQGTLPRAFVPQFIVLQAKDRYSNPDAWFDNIWVHSP